jgi:hypothetical protein
MSRKHGVPIEVYDVTITSPSSTPEVSVSCFPIPVDNNGGKTLKLGRIEFPRPHSGRPFQHYLWIVAQQLNKKAIAALGNDFIPASV